MKTSKVASIILASIVVSTVVAKPVVQVTSGTKGGISRTVIETWQLSDDEKKNSVMMSSISATAIAPTVTMKRGTWTAPRGFRRSRGRRS